LNLPQNGNNFCFKKLQLTEEIRMNTTENLNPLHTTTPLPGARGVYTIAIDQSTSATKAMLFDQNAALVGRVSIDHKQYYPKPGWVEHDPVEIIENTYKAVEQLITEAHADLDCITSVAITNQRETVVVWDKRTGKPIYNAVVWQCNRGAQICEELLAQGHEPMVMQKTGLIINPYFSASGAKWILDNVSGARQAAQEGHLLLGTMDSWLIWNFTEGKVHATDYTNASRTLLFNINTLSWDEELLKLFTIPSGMLPEALPCDGQFGTTTMNGIFPAIPIAGVLGDSHGALAGQMCFSNGMGKATYGTGSSIMVNIGEKALPAPRGLVTSIGFAAKGKVYYAFEGNIHCTGATIKWLQDDLQLIRSAAETEELATSVKSTDGVYFVPAFAGLGAPWWDNDAKALICGMNRGTGKAHIVRAALESIAYQVKDLMNLIYDSGVELVELRVDGGPVKNNFLMQFQADMLQAKINRSPIEEASALGAVLMNGFAMNQLRDLASAAALRTRNDYIEPQMDISKVNELHDQWKMAVKRTLMK
jgi:glycerol kinase